MSKFPDKYNLTRRESVFLAKKTLVASIYNSARLEGVNITFPETKVIVDGTAISGMDLDDLQIILNLRNAWKYILNNISSEETLDLACKINGFVSYNESLEWGDIRKGSVGISGVNYKPEVPNREETERYISELMNSDESITFKAIRYMLYGMRSQLFWDGNKRTSTLFANKLLIKHGKGLISVPEELLPEFHKRLSAFYETNDYGEIDTFIYDKCLYGIDY